MKNTTNGTAGRGDSPFSVVVIDVVPDDGSTKNTTMKNDTAGGGDSPFSVVVNDIVPDDGSTKKQYHHEWYCRWR